MDIDLKQLSSRAINALELATAGKPLNLDTLKGLRQRDIWVMRGYSRVTTNEIRFWLLDRYNIDMPE